MREAPAPGGVGRGLGELPVGTAHPRDGPLQSASSLPTPVGLERALSPRLRAKLGQGSTAGGAQETGAEPLPTPLLPSAPGSAGRGPCSPPH